MRQNICNLTEEGVAELVASAIVDLLEVVTVEDEHAQRNATLLRGGHLVLEPLFEPTAVQDALSASVIALCRSR